MMKLFLNSVKYILGKDIAGRDLFVFPDDTFIVSYPRSGNTWARFLIANLIHQDKPVTFANIEPLIPDVCVQSKRYLKSVPRPRIIKSHEYFDLRYKKVIYIVRDPRDVAVSYYHFCIKKRKYGIGDGYPIDRYVTRFVAGELSSYGSWGVNVASWLATRQNTVGFLLIHYEDMLDQTERELAKIASFLGLDPTLDRLATAIERSSVDRMRQLESEQADVWVNTKESRKDIPFVRTCTSGQWKLHLPENSVAEIESAWGPLMGMLGYKPVTVQPKASWELPCASSFTS